MTIRWAQRDPDQACRDLAAWLDRQPGISQAQVAGWRMPQAGSSYETVFCRARWNQDGTLREEDLVVRIQPPAYSLFPDADIFLQSSMMRALAAHSSIPVPKIYWTERDTSVLGAPFFVMARIDGDIPPDLISRRHGNFVECLSFGERATLYANGIETMAALHQVDIGTGFAFLTAGQGSGTGLDRYLSWVEHWHRWVAKGRHFALIEAGLRRLRDQQPSSPPDGIIWGDARPGNMIFRPDLRPAAVIDWEMAAIGPGEVDLGWWVMWETIWNAEDDHPEWEGFLGRDQMLACYENAADRPVQNFTYYELLAAVRLAVMMVIGVDKRVEAGVLPASTTAGTHNLGTRLIARLLGWPIPPISPDLASLAAEMGDA